MTRLAHRALLAVLLIGLTVASPSAGANLDQLMRDFRAVPAGSKAAPPFSLATLGGKPTALAEQRDRPILLYFWATW
jgi:cytochrome oxidase Cu insertion factor (SCO1/SenC/PrrC family)